MIKVNIYRDISGAMTGFDVLGHSGYAKAGEDILCSAVSAITQTALQGITAVAMVETKYKREDGQLSCRIPVINYGVEKIKCAAILETMLLGLQNIQEGFREHLIVEDDVNE